MPCFVLLYHECPPNYERPSHWDLMFEFGDVLRTWALEQLPGDWQAAHSQTITTIANCRSLAEKNTVAAIQLGDHRRDYLHLEGPLSGNRGNVIRVAAGAYRSESYSPDCWRIAIAGSELSGKLTLTRSSAESSQWTLECRPAG